MKTAASASRALTLLAVVLVAATLLMDNAEASRRGRPKGDKPRRGGCMPELEPSPPPPPATLSEAIARCVCERTDENPEAGTEENACISCLETETDPTNWTEISTCLTTAGIDINITASCIGSE